MENKLSIESAIEQFVSAFSGENASVREKHICREALRSLVRLAKSEQMAEMKMDVEKLMLSIPAIAPSPVTPSAVGPLLGLQQLQLNRAG